MWYGRIFFNCGNHGTRGPTPLHPPRLTNACIAIAFGCGPVRCRQWGMGYVVRMPWLQQCLCGDWLQNADDRKTWKYDRSTEKADNKYFPVLRHKKDARFPTSRRVTLKTTLILPPMVFFCGGLLLGQMPWEMGNWGKEERVRGAPRVVSTRFLAEGAPYLLPKDCLP